MMLQLNTFINQVPLNMQPYVFNKDTVYKARGFYSEKKLHDLRYLDIYVSNTDKFTAKPLDILSKYKLPNVTSDKVVDRWNSNHMGFYQNQCNWALWCSTTGCGISAKDHLSAAEPLMRAVYEFHAYFQMRRILKEISAPLPQDGAWDPFNNSYNRRGFERICNVFGVDVNNDWRQRASHNRGLGSVYNNLGAGYRVWHNGEYHRQIMAFEQRDCHAGCEIIHIDYIAQGAEADRVWTTFVANESQGFTKPGVVRLDESIRTYVYCILAAQGQIQSDIIGGGNALTAQQQFLELVEKAINYPVDAPGSVARYQDALKYARSSLNYVVGYDLHLNPSDMQLTTLDGQIAGYNNLLQVASKDLKLGSNEHINNTLAVVTRTPRRKGLPSVDHLPPRPAPQPTTSLEERALADQHAGERTALTLGLSAVGLGILWFLR